MKDFGNIEDCFIKIKDKNNITLAEGEMGIPKPLPALSNFEILELVIEKFAYPINASIVKIYAILPSVGDMVLDRELTYPSPIIKVSNNEGIKYDKAKPLAGDVLQIFGKAIMGVGQCILKGAEKYPEIDNWKRVENAERRYTNALVRHLIKHLIGEEVDKESGLPHLQHVVWNALAVCELYLERRKNDK